MTIARARLALGGNLKVIPSVNRCEFLDLPGGSQGVALQGRTVDLIFAGSGIRTTRGIHVGSTRAAMRRAYGRSAVQRDHRSDSAITEFWDVRRGALALEFAIYRDRVAGIEVGRANLVHTFNECA